MAGIKNNNNKIMSLGRNRLSDFFENNVSIHGPQVMYSMKIKLRDKIVSNISIKNFQGFVHKFQRIYVYINVWQKNRALNYVRPLKRRFN